MSFKIAFCLNPATGCLHNLLKQNVKEVLSLPLFLEPEASGASVPLPPSLQTNCNVREQSLCIWLHSFPIAACFTVELAANLPWEQ